MTVVGQFGLLIAFVASGYAGFACWVGGMCSRRALARTGDAAAVAAALALTAVSGVLAWALAVKDFRFAYVAEYSSRTLPWHYSLSALWVGQAGSLLVWAWLLGVLTLVYRFWPRRTPSELRGPATGVLMACVGFLAAVMVYGADPARPSLGTLPQGAGMSPLLQHPAMLIHPPIVFLGYAGWTVPLALAVAALASGKLDAAWVRQSRPWALFAWAVLGAGILWGALWAYQELGWGGYWAWDPVENGSLIPWLTGTALVHALLAWQYRGLLKKTTLVLAVATFALCNFASFSTRSGFFSSLHAFGESPIGWMFLIWMAVFGAGGAALIVWRRSKLAPDHAIESLWARESLVFVGVIALGLLAGVTLAGTLAVPLSKLATGRALTVGPPFYNNVLIPIGLLLLATTAVVPLVRWGQAPTAGQRRMLAACTAAAAIAPLVALFAGVRHPIGLAVAWVAALAPLSVVGAVVFDPGWVRAIPGLADWVPLLRGSRALVHNVRATLLPPSRGTRRDSRNVSVGRCAGRPSGRPAKTFTARFLAILPRRQYAGLLVHLGFVCLAVGVTGSSLGTQRHEALLRPGATIAWAGRSIRFVEMVQRELPDKFVAEARLEVSCGGGQPRTLRPAQHRHLTHDEWTTEVGIDSTWAGDLYTVLYGGEEDGSARLAFVSNPLMRCMWLGGWIMGAGALLGLLPARRSATWAGDDAAPPSRAAHLPLAGPLWKQPAARRRPTQQRRHSKDSRSKSPRKG